MYLVTGATGNAGSAVVGALTAAGEQVRALTHSGHADVPAGVEVVTGDLNKPATVASALAGVRGAFLLSGYDNLPELLAAMRSAGVERVVLLSSSSAATGDTDNAVAAYHIASEATVRESGLPWTFLRPHTFMTNTLQWVRQLATGDVVRDAFGDVAVSAVDPADIGAVAAAALTNPDHAGQTYRLTGPAALRPADRLAILGTVLGRDLRFEGLSHAGSRAEMSKTMPAKYVDAFHQFFADGALDESPVTGTVREVTGREPRTFEQWARANADAFR